MELWHTRLGRRIAPDRPGGRIVDEIAGANPARAVWTRDFDIGPKPFDALEQEVPSTKEPLAALTPSDRVMIVHQTSNFRLNWKPPAIKVDNLVLSSLGGWLSSHVDWTTRPSAQPFDLEEWRHVATLGRDHFVRVIKTGFLYPFGHRASFVSVTERKFAPGAGKPAYLFKRMFVIVREPSRTYSQAEQPAFDGGPGRPDRLGQHLQRLFPFTTVRLTTLVTPNLAPIKNFGSDRDPLFFPAVGNTAFAFKCVAVDLDGKVVKVSTPLLYMDATLNATVDALSLVRTIYEAQAKGRNTAKLFGQSVALAPSVGGRPGAGCLDVSQLKWTGEVPQTMNVDVATTARFVPVVVEAQAVIPAISQMAGNSAPSTVVFADAYGKSGFSPDDNPGELFLKVASKTAIDFAGQGDRSGGLVTPSFEVSGLSRKAGPLGGKLDTIAAGGFVPSDVFGDALKANLFGVIPLQELVAGPGPAGPLAIPSFLTERLNAVTTLLSLLDRTKRMLDALAEQVDPGNTQKSLTTSIEDLAKGVDDLAAGRSGPDLGKLAAAVRDPLGALAGALPAGADPALGPLLAEHRQRH